MGRTFDVNYRYGFNGKEHDNDPYGQGNVYDYGFRIYNPRLGKFLSVDPLYIDFPWYSPFQFAGNKPILCLDLDGLEELIYTENFDLKNDLLNVSQSSEILNQIIQNVSNPDLKDNVKIYFAKINLPQGSKGTSVDLLGDYGLKLYEKAVDYYGKTDLTDADFKALGEEVYRYYSYFSESLLATGLTLEKLKEMRANNPDLQIHVVGVSTEFTTTLESELSEALKVTFHELDFHIAENIKGNKKDGVQQHKDSYAYDENKEYYDEMGWNPSDGSSPSSDKAAPGSRAFIIFKEIDKYFKK